MLLVEPFPPKSQVVINIELLSSSELRDYCRARAPVAEHSAQALHHGHPTGSQHEAHADHATHDKHAGHSVAIFRDKFWISLALTIATLIWRHMLQGELGYTAALLPRA